MSNETFCSQCGQDFSAPACGPTHAVRANELRIERKEKNECCRSCLQDAIRSIRKANEHWPFVYTTALIESLEQLKAKIKAELYAKTEPVTPRDL